MISRLSVFFHGLLHNPLRVFTFGIVVTIVMLTFDGSLWRFWSLQRGQEEMRERLSVLQEKSKNLDFQIHQANSLTFIERQATDQFDYVREGDLIFVFGD